MAKYCQKAQLLSYIQETLLQDKRVLDSMQEIIAGQSDVTVEKLGQAFSLSVYLQLAGNVDLIQQDVLCKFDLNRVPFESIYSSLMIAT